MKLFKVFVSILVLSLTQQAFAKDMSRTESSADSYYEGDDGSYNYTGSCTTHQDYADIHFKVTETLVEYFVPSDLKPAETKKALAGVEPELVEATFDTGSDYSDEIRNGFDYLTAVDDVTLEKIEHLTIPGLDLYRFNIGVGGGNGYYQVFNRTQVGSEVSYELMSYVFDGDLEFCHEIVWKKPAL